MKVRDEINKFSTESDKVILHWLLDNYHFESQWRFVAKCTHQRYGTLSYETNRIWSPTKEGMVLFNNKEQLENQI